MGYFRSQRSAAWWPWPLNFWSLNGITGQSCYGILSCQFSACYALPFST